MESPGSSLSLAALRDDSRISNYDSLSHTHRRFSRYHRFHALEPLHRFAIANPTRRVATIFRPTNFRKANRGRVAQLFFRTLRHCARAPVYLHPARRMQVLPAENGAKQLERALSSAQVAFLRWGQRTLQPTKTAASEMHRADASLAEQVCRSDRHPEERSTGRVFARVDTDCAMSFQIIRIVRRQV